MLASVMLPLTILTPQEGAEQRQRVRSEGDAGHGEFPAPIANEMGEIKEQDDESSPSDDEAKDASYEISEEEDDDDDDCVNEPSDDDYVSDESDDNRSYYGTRSRAARKEKHKH